MWSLGCILGEMLLGKLTSAVSSKIVFSVLSIFTSAISPFYFNEGRLITLFVHFRKATFPWHINFRSD